MFTYTAIFEHDLADGDWTTYVPALNHLSTSGRTEAEALRYTKEAVIGYLQALRNHGEPFPADQIEPAKPGQHLVTITVQL